MIHHITEFIGDYGGVAQGTQAIMDALDDASLSQEAGDGHRTLGRVAWHVVQTIPEMLGKTGLTPDGPGEDTPVPTTAKAIADAYREASRSVLAQVEAQWTDDTLEVEDELYGSKWKRGSTLWALVHHEIHHRGQMTVLMRQAGLRVPGVYGPAKEDWEKMGMQPPVI